MRLQPGTLRTYCAEATARARRLGVLHTIPTRQQLVEEEGIRRLEGAAADHSVLNPKEQAPGLPPVERNPFLPYEATLYVADISDTHVCLLNKFNVVDDHLLIVTRRFEAQETLLTLDDFEALWRCMAEYEGLGFYNGGKVAGASQRHKHLQFVPLPLGPGGIPAPLETALAQTVFTGAIGVSPLLPFVHAVAAVDPIWLTTPLAAASATLDLYEQLLAAIGLPIAPGQHEQPGPYNLLLTRRWLWLVPRSQETVDGISINALGFAGSLFVRDEEQWAQVNRLGPLELLRRVGVTAALG